ncbi:MAG: hypothetical protein JO084_20475 [Bradyrhizobiaceae bacterium]|nr:hypothetical protein [Hyphomicrobiales bacterium]MBV9430102.1 hypothetical protein [Bradyrhizobiaceae bacterium]
MSAAAANAPSANPLSAAPVLSQTNTYYPAASAAAIAPSALAGFLSEQQLAMPTAGVGNFHGSQA